MGGMRESERERRGRGEETEKRDKGGVSLRHRGGHIQKINAWYLNTHMVYL